MTLESAVHSAAIIEVASSNTRVLLASRSSAHCAGLSLHLLSSTLLLLDDLLFRARVSRFKVNDHNEILVIFFVKPLHFVNFDDEIFIFSRSTNPKWSRRSQFQSACHGCRFRPPAGGSPHAATATHLSFHPSALTCIPFLCSSPHSLSDTVIPSYERDASMPSRSLLAQQQQPLSLGMVSRLPRWQDAVATGLVSQSFQTTAARGCDGSMEARRRYPAEADYIDWGALRRWGSGD